MNLKSKKWKTHSRSYLSSELNNKVGTFEIVIFYAWVSKLFNTNVHLKLRIRASRTLYILYIWLCLLFVGYPQKYRTGLRVIKTFQHEFCTHTQTSSNQNTVFIGYNILIGCYALCKSTHIVLKHFMTARPELYSGVRL